MAIHNGTNSGSRATVFGSKLFLHHGSRGPFRPDAADLALSQLGFIAAMIASVLAVLFVCAPAKIVDGTVPWVAVKVSAFHASGAGPDESLKNDTMEQSGMPFAISDKINAEIGAAWPTMLVNKWPHLMSRPSYPKFPNASIGAGFVVGKPWNSPILNSQLRSHDAVPCNGVVVRVGGFVTGIRQPVNYSRGDNA